MELAADQNQLLTITEMLNATNISQHAVLYILLIKSITYSFPCLGTFPHFTSL